LNIASSGRALERALAGTLLVRDGSASRAAARERQMCAKACSAPAPTVRASAKAARRRLGDERPHQRIGRVSD
jgi:hypothetical protein